MIPATDEFNGRPAAAKRAMEELGLVLTFRVRYYFYTEAAGGLRHLPHQGVRCDWSYAADDPEERVVYMIWPVFEDDQGRIITDCGRPVPMAGTARMHIANRNMAEEVHRQRVAVGVCGHFMVGPRRIAEAEIIEVVVNDP